MTGPSALSRLQIRNPGSCSAAPFGDWNSIDRMLREVVLTLREEQACLNLWFKDKSVDQDVRRRIETSLTKISEALGKLAALEKG
jgi:hypothetical protein